jgi:hypothetical protein
LADGRTSAGKRAALSCRLNRAVGWSDLADLDPTHVRAALDVALGRAPTRWPSCEETKPVGCSIKADVKLG